MRRKVYGQHDGPEIGWWGCTFVRQVGKFMDGHHVEERVVVIRLPVFGVAPRMDRDCYSWGQRILVYLGQSGFQLRWHFEPGAECYRGGYYR